MMSGERYSCSVECSHCAKTFKSLRTMWRHMLKSHQPAMAPTVFEREWSTCEIDPTHAYNIGI